MAGVPGQLQFDRAGRAAVVLGEQQRRAGVRRAPGVGGGAGAPARGGGEKGKRGGGRGRGWWWIVWGMSFFSSP
ncbi:hypothetical protein ACFDR9_005619, partial [Janthinobacterium sp. CG_23.3]